jgi:hypothetical protein
MEKINTNKISIELNYFEIHIDFIERNKYNYFLDFLDFLPAVAGPPKNELCCAGAGGAPKNELCCAGAGSGTTCCLGPNKYSHHEPPPLWFILWVFLLWERIFDIIKYGYIFFINKKLLNLRFPKNCFLKHHRLIW